MSEPTQPQESRPPMTAPQVPTQTPTQAQPQAPSLTPEQQEFMNILNDLILSAQELAYELATIDQSVLDKHPELRDLLEKAKNVVRNVKRFHEFVKARTRGARR